MEQQKESFPPPFQLDEMFEEEFKQRDGPSSVTNSTNSNREKKKFGKRPKSMVPGGTKMDTVSMLNEAIHHAAATTTLPHHHLANSDLHVSLKPTCFCSSAAHARELRQ